MEFILIIFMHASTFSLDNAVALEQVGTFAEKDLCEVAGENTIKKFKTLFKSGEYICVRIK
ncbi:MAG: hypothetical protein ACO25K_06385 [Candidatus Fonsibacter ubiquis]